MSGTSEHSIWASKAYLSTTYSAETSLHVNYSNGKVPHSQQNEQSPLLGPNICLWLFICFFFLRYFRTLVNAMAFWTIKIVKVPLKPTVTPNDVTVILPTTFTDDILECLLSILRNQPHEVLLVVPENKFNEADDMVLRENLKGVLVLDVPALGKRLQMVRGLCEVQTSITVFSDDDVVWSPSYLVHLLTAFEDEKVGASGTNQRVLRESGSLWNVLGIAYLERRNFNTFATNRIDGGISTLSGRTCAYRTNIINTPEFYQSFTQDYFLGVNIKIGDDKKLTKWVYSHGWKIKLVHAGEDAVLYTRLCEGPLYLDQCLRWARTHWQGNVSNVLDMSGSCSYIWKRHPWTFYSTYLGSLFSPTLLWDVGLFIALKHGLLAGSPGVREDYCILVVYWVWVFAMKTVKMWSHFLRQPSDILYLPCLIGFSYFHGFINLYALLTMTASCWGGRPSVQEEEKCPIDVEESLLT